MNDGTFPQRKVMFGSQNMPRKQGLVSLAAECLKARRKVRLFVLQ
jgi:hypothetical protein